MNAFGGGLAMTNGGTLTLTNANVTGNTALSGAGGDGGNGKAARWERWVAAVAATGRPRGAGSI